METQKMKAFELGLGKKAQTRNSLVTRSFTARLTRLIYNSSWPTRLINELSSSWPQLAHL